MQPGFVKNHTCLLYSFFITIFKTEVGLQFCVSFRCTARWFSYTYIYVSLFFFRFFSIVVVYSLSHVQIFCDPMDCSPLGFSLHEISQSRILEWIAISFSRRFSQLREGSKPSLLHWQADSLLLSHQGSPFSIIDYYKMLNTVPCVI